MDDSSGRAAPSTDGRDLRIFLGAQAVTLLGGSVQQVALLWLVYRVSQSPETLGWMGFASGVPAALMAPLAGVLADRFPARGLLVATQFGLGLLALSFAGLAVLPSFDPRWVLGLVACQGLLNGTDVPVRQVLLARLVPRREDLAPAIAANSMIYDGARLAGPALGGLVLALSSAAACFLGNALGCWLVAGLYLVLRPIPRGVAAPAGGVIEEFADGLRYAAGDQAIRAILILSAGISFAGSAYMILTPVMAADFLSAGPKGLGLLLGAVGAGAIAGSVAFRPCVRAAGPARLIAIGAGVFALGIVAFSQSRIFALSALALAVVGFGIMQMMAACNLVLVQIADPARQGRILSLFTLSYLAAAPLGCIVAGQLGASLGAPGTLLGSSLLAGLAALAFWTALPAVERALATVEIPPS